MTLRSAKMPRKIAQQVTMIRSDCAFCRKAELKGITVPPDCRIVVRRRKIFFRLPKPINVDREQRKVYIDTIPRMLSFTGGMPDVVGQVQRLHAQSLERKGGASANHDSQLSKVEGCTTITLQAEDTVLQTPAITVTSENSPPLMDVVTWTTFGCRTWQGVDMHLAFRAAEMNANRKRHRRSSSCKRCVRDEETNRKWGGVMAELRGTVAWEDELTEAAGVLKLQDEQV